MNKGGMGVGSASIMLVFAVLCLTVFSLISLSVAQNDKALVDAETQLVVSYYRADELATRVLAEILKKNTAPDSETILGVDIKSYYDTSREKTVTRFTCPMNDTKELGVEVAIHDGTYDIISWRMHDTGNWDIDTSIPVWQG